MNTIPRYVACAFVLHHLACCQHAQIVNVSTIPTGCSENLDDVDGDDTSVLLQRSALSANRGVVRNDLAHASPGMQETRRAVPFPRNAWQLNHSYDMYAGLALALISLVLFLLTYMLNDGRTLGAPIEDNNENGRTSLLDNVKFVMVSMVIVHHSSLVPEKTFGLSRPLLEKPWGDLIFFTCVPLHTRTLCFVSGILSRGSFKPEKVLVRLLGPFVLFCFVLLPLSQFLQRCYWGIEKIPWAPVDNPLYQLFRAGGHLQWYLMALVWWRVLGSLIASFSPLVRMLAACMLAAMASYMCTEFLSMFYAFEYFPAFVAGQLFPIDQAVSKLKWRPITALVGVVLLVGAECIRTFREEAQYAFVFGPIYGTFWRKFDNTVANPADLPFFWLRSLAYTFIEILKSIVFLVLVCPRETCVFTQAGKHSIYPYLLHMGFALPWLSAAAASSPWLDGTFAVTVPLKVLVVTLDIIICFLTCAALASWPVRVVFGPLIEPTWISKLFQEGSKGQNE